MGQGKRQKSSVGTLRNRLARFAAATAIAACAGVPLSACSDEGPAQSEQSGTSSGTHGAHTAKWLDLSNPLSPAQWLMSRGEAKPRPLHDPEVRRIGVLLVSAHKRYRESERMIANRAVQVSAMLDQIGLAEAPAAILDDLTGIGAEAGQTEGFGAISQYYFNLRAADVSRADALAKLKARYGSSS